MAIDFVFDLFYIDSRARELRLDGAVVPLSVAAFDCLVYLISNRDRPVGRDELISAVWGRSDVSESTLAHTIARLRQVLNDGPADAHRYIRTVPRLGYRWVGEAHVTERQRIAPPTRTSLEPSPSTKVDPETGAIAHESVLSDRQSATLRARRFFKLRLNSKLLWGATIASVVLLAFVFRNFASTMGSSRSSVAIGPIAPGDAVLVEPVQVHGEPADSWMRLGMMDLIANRLRGSGVPTLPSETTLVLSGRTGNAFPSGVALRIRTSLTRVGDAWLAILEATSPDGGIVNAQARDSDAIRASKTAADALLQALGASASAQRHVGDNGETDLLAKVSAYRLDDKPIEALALIDASSVTFRNNFAIRIARMRIVCDLRREAECDSELRALQSLPAGQISLENRASVKVSRAWFDINIKHDRDGAARMLDDVVALHASIENSDTLGNAYSLRGWLRYAKGQHEEAMSDLGMARRVFLTTGNLREIARVDQRIGIVQDAQGQVVAALASLQASGQALRNIGAESDMTVNRMALSQVQSRLLQHHQAVDTIESGLRPAVSKDPGFLSFRARALIGDGRLAAAEALVESRAATEDGLPGADPVELSDARALMARIALARADCKKAAEWSVQALSPEYASADSVAYLENGLIAIRALNACGQRGQAHDIATQLDEPSMPGDSAADRILKLQIRAEGAIADHRTEDALDAFAEALGIAEKLGVPDTLVDVAAPYVHALLASRRLDEASRVAADIAQWAANDARAAKAQADLLRALGQEAAARAKERQAQHLAGEGSIANFAPLGTSGHPRAAGSPDRIGRK